MMPYKEKAKELVDIFLPLVDCGDNRYTTKVQKENAKQCALIAVQLHLDELAKMKLIFSDRELHYKFWQQVKTEIENL